jgi:hypothetical protein
VCAGSIPESYTGWDSGTEPVQAPGEPVHRPAAPDLYQELKFKPLSSMTQKKYEEIVRRCQRFVQGNIDLKKRTTTNSKEIQ